MCMLVVCFISVYIFIGVFNVVACLLILLNISFASCEPLEHIIINLRAYQDSKEPDVYEGKQRSKECIR